MELSIQERLKDLRVERGLTLEQLAEETKLSKSALGSYEAAFMSRVDLFPKIELKNSLNPIIYYLCLLFTKLI